MEYFLISRKFEFLISENPTFLILRIIFIDIRKLYFRYTKVHFFYQKFIFRCHKICRTFWYQNYIFLYQIYWYIDFFISKYTQKYWKRCLRKIKYFDIKNYIRNQYFWYRNTIFNIRKIITWCRKICLTFWYQKIDFLISANYFSYQKF